jgi:hypothetical protein
MKTNPTEQEKIAHIAIEINGGAHQRMRCEGLRTTLPGALLGTSDTWGT